MLKGNFGDLGTERKRVGYDQPLCPKPRRLSSSIHEFLKPIKCSKHSLPNFDEGNGILNMITDKNGNGKELVCNGCSPCSYPGSPPRRTENPLIHDVEFLHQVEVVSPLSQTNKLSDKFGITR